MRYYEHSKVHKFYRFTASSGSSKSSKSSKFLSVPYFLIFNVYWHRFVCGFGWQYSPQLNCHTFFVRLSGWSFSNYLAGFCNNCFYFTNIHYLLLILVPSYLLLILPSICNGFLFSIFPFPLVPPHMLYPKMFLFPYLFCILPFLF